MSIRVIGNQPFIIRLRKRWGLRVGGLIETTTTTTSSSTTTSTSISTTSSTITSSSTSSTMTSSSSSSTTTTAPPVFDSDGSTFNRGDFTVDNAFLWSSLDLSPYAGTDLGLTTHKVVAVDGAGKVASGFLAGIGASEATIEYPMVSFVFDDGANTSYTVMRPVFQAAGVVGCLAIVTDYLGDPPAAGVLTYAQLQALADDGWEIMSHTKSHPDLTTLSEAELREELSVSKAILEGLGYTVNNIVYPNGSSNDFVRGITAEYYRSGRGATAAKINDPFNLVYMNLEHDGADDHTQLAYYKTEIDKAKARNEWKIFVLHVTDSDDAATIGELIDYIQSEGVEIVTVNQALNNIENEFRDGKPFGHELLKEWTNVTYDTFVSLYKDILSAIETGGASATANSSLIGLISGELVRSAITVTLISGSVPNVWYPTSSHISTPVAGVETVHYKTTFLVDLANAKLQHYRGGNRNYSSINSFKRVTDPPATGIHIVSSLNGTTRAWESIESGFDPNAIASWKIYAT